MTHISNDDLSEIQAYINEVKKEIRQQTAQEIFKEIEECHIVYGQEDAIGDVDESGFDCEEVKEIKKKYLGDKNSEE